MGKTNICETHLISEQVLYLAIDGKQRFQEALSQMSKYLTYSFLELLIFFRLVFEVSEAVVQRSSRPEVLCAKGSLKISQNSQENTSVRVSFFIKLQTLGLQEHLFYRIPPVAASEVYF